MQIPTYTGTNISVAEGDVVTFDGRSGQIKLICLPATKAATDYDCYESGGLLIDFEEFGLVLEPFGFAEEIHKLS